MKNAATIAKINGISKLHYLNYDYIIQDRNLYVILEFVDHDLRTYLENL